MVRRLHILLLLLLGCLKAYSQEVTHSVKTDSISDSVLTHPTDSLLASPTDAQVGLPPSRLSIDREISLFNPLRVSPYFFDSKKITPRLGNLTGYSLRESLPGLMGIESMALGYTFAGEHLSFTPSVYANKYAFFNGLTTSYGIGGELSYKINDHFSITAFGQYFTNAWASNPAVLSNMISSRYGGYATWHINDTWGLNVGAQRVYNSAINQWQTVPIVMPTLKINGHDAIGIDLGGLIYQAIESHRYHQNGVYGNPTIAPPVHPQVSFGPRE